MIREDNYLRASQKPVHKVGEVVANVKILAAKTDKIGYAYYEIEHLCCHEPGTIKPNTLYYRIMRGNTMCRSCSSIAMNRRKEADRIAEQEAKAVVSIPFTYNGWGAPPSAVNNGWKWMDRGR